MTRLDETAKRIRLAFAESGADDRGCDAEQPCPDHEGGAMSYRINTYPWETLSSQDKHPWLHMAAAAMEET